MTTRAVSKIIINAFPTHQAHIVAIPFPINQSRNAQTRLFRHHFYLQSWPPAHTLDKQQHLKALHPASAADTENTEDKHQQQESLTSRLQQVVDKYVLKAGDKWKELGDQPAGSLRKRLYDLGNRLIVDRVPVDEIFLKSVTHEIIAGGKLPALQLALPHLTVWCLGANQGDEAELKTVQTRFTQMLQERMQIHERGLRLSKWGIPASLIAGILPGPNVFLAYALFRLYSNSRSITAVQILQRMSTENTIGGSPGTPVVDFRALDMSVQDLSKHMPDDFEENMWRTKKQIDAQESDTATNKE